MNKICVSIDKNISKTEPGKAISALDSKRYGDGGIMQFIKKKITRTVKASAAWSLIPFSAGRSSSKVEHIAHSVVEMGSVRRPRQPEERELNRDGVRGYDETFY